MKQQLYRLPKEVIIEKILPDLLMEMDAMKLQLEMQRHADITRHDCVACSTFCFKFETTSRHRDEYDLTDRFVVSTHPLESLDRMQILLGKEGKGALRAPLNPL
jgi:hypothetical protein